MNKDQCSMIRGPQICLVYIYAIGGAQGYRDKALQFVASYLANPPELDHETVIVCNGVPVSDDARDIFAALPNLSFLNHDDSGWDIGGFQLASRTIPCGLMVFCGGHTYFRKPGWLVRIWEVFSELGNTLYGSTGNQGDTRFNVFPHVRTTGFWCDPKLLASYPHLITSTGGGGQRYEMEHGPTCLSNWVKKFCREPLIVGWDCVWPLSKCDQMPGGFHNGTQYNILIGDRLTCPPYHHMP